MWGGILVTINIESIISNMISELASYEDTGLIRGISGNEKGISDSAKRHFQELEQTFGSVKPEFLEAIVNFKKDAYLSLLALDFLDAGSDRAEKYAPERFLDSVHNLSLAMANTSQVNDFYADLSGNLKKSSRFVYHLVVKDLSTALCEAKPGPDYSKEAFSQFALEVLNHALPYSQGSVTDKWSFFKGEFDAIKAKYFPSEKIEDGITRDYIDMIVSGGGNNGAESPVDHFMQDRPKIIGMDYSRKRGADKAEVIFLTGDRNRPVRQPIGISIGRDTYLKPFLIGLADRLLRQFNATSYNDPLYNMTTAARTNIARQL